MSRNGVLVEMKREATSRGFHEKEAQVLVDFYNLELTKEAEEDKPIIMGFFEKYAPRVLKYRTSEEIEQIKIEISVDPLKYFFDRFERAEASKAGEAFKELSREIREHFKGDYKDEDWLGWVSDVFPEKMLLLTRTTGELHNEIRDASPEELVLLILRRRELRRILIDSFRKYLKRGILERNPEEYMRLECGGTLGWFKYTNNESWFSSKAIRRFYDLHHLIHLIADSRIEKTNIFKTDLHMMECLLLYDISLSLYARDKVTNEELELNPAIRFPKEMDPEEYEFGTNFVGRYKDTGDDLALGRVKAGLFYAIMDVLNGFVQLDRCRLDKCSNVFTVRPSGKRQKYCSDSHRVLAYRKRKEEAAVLHTEA